jgi:hemerythrin-like domain-containing protein
MNAATDTLEQLQTDHRHLARLLFMLQAEVDRLNMPDGEPMNLERVVEALDYLRDYPQQCHHPTEDVAYERLLEKSLSARQRATIDRIEREHGTLEVLAKDLAAEFGRVEQDSVVAATVLHRKTTQFVQALYQHLRAEEDGLFPLMRDLFDAADWAAVGKKLAAQSDPLFGERRASFDELYRYILAAEAAT